MTTKRITGLIALILAVIVGYYWWKTSSQTAALGSGDVTSSDGSTNANIASKMDSGAVDLDGRHVDSNSYPSSAPLQVAPKNQSAQASTGSMNAPAPMPTATPIPAAASQNSDLPSGDTLPTNAPSGMAFGGSGIYQWYRQGNLTWRINTKNGAMCVAFATMDEWAKPIVAAHGCGNA